MTRKRAKGVARVFLATQSELALEKLSVMGIRATGACHAGELRCCLPFGQHKQEQSVPKCRICDSGLGGSSSIDPMNFKVQPVF